MMNSTDGWTGGGLWLWTVIGVPMVVLLGVVIGKLSKKQSCVHDPAGK